DLNHNGLLDAGEPGIANNAIELHAAADGHLIDTQVTDGNGHYLFAGDPTQPKSVGTQTVDAVFAAAPTDQSRGADLAQFDPPLGTLRSVDIIFDATLTTAVKVESLDAAAGQASATVTGTLDLTLPGSQPPLEMTLTRETGPADLSAADGAIDFAGTAAHDFGSQATADEKTLTLSSDDTDLSAFLG